MTALEPSEISARRRSAVVLALALLRLCGGFILAFPLSSAISSSGIGLRDGGDRALFAGGGYVLLELFRLHGDALAATARGLLPLFALGLALTGAGNVALLVALNVRERLQLGPWLSHAFALLPAQLVVAAGASLAKLALLVIGAMAVASVPESLAKPVVASAAQLAVFAPFVLLCGAVGGFEDLTKASLVRHAAPLADGVERAWSTLRKRPISGSLGWIPYALPFGLVALAAAQLVDLLDVSRAGSWRVAAVFGLHQLVIGVSVACRAAWFARALRLSA
jgi:hypothetical protein